MAIRLTITICLALTLAFLAKSLVQTWRSDPFAGDLQQRPGAKMRQERSLAVPKTIRFYPPPSRAALDLNQGYLFNADRSLAENAPAKSDSQVPEAVDIHDVQYTGSIIMGEVREAIISYPASRAAGRRPGRPRQRKKFEHTHLGPGDSFGGYTVAEVLPEKIVFSRDNEIIERPLHDPAKERAVVPKRAAKPGQRRVPVAPPTMNRGRPQPGTPHRPTRPTPPRPPDRPRPKQQ